MARKSKRTEESSTPWVLIGSIIGGFGAVMLVVAIVVVIVRSRGSSNVAAAPTPGPGRIPAPVQPPPPQPVKPALPPGPGAPGGRPGAEVLAEALATVNKTDASWTYTDMIKNRKVAKANGADQVLAASKLIPGPGAPPIDMVPQSVAGFPLNKTSHAAARAEMEKLGQAVVAARRMALFPEEGSYSWTIAKNPLETPLPHLQADAVKVAHLLYIDARVMAAENNLDEALDSCRAMVNVCRSIGDEPFGISQLVRLSLLLKAMDCFSGVLSSPAPLSEQRLLEFVPLLEEEAKNVRIRNYFRAERALMHDLHAKFATGELAFSHVKEMERFRPQQTDEHLKLVLPESHAYYLLKCTRLMEELPKQPIHTWLKIADKQMKGWPGFSIMIDRPGELQVVQAYQKAHAKVQIELIKQASLRYRWDNGKHPSKAEDLVPKYLPKFPLNPYDGTPMTMVAEGNLLVIRAPSVFVRAQDTPADTLFTVHAIRK